MSEYAFSWLIWSMQHGMWWAPDKKGYTADRREAGRYSYEDACKIVRGANWNAQKPDEAMVRDESYCCGARMVNGGVQCESCGSDGQFGV